MSNEFKVGDRVKVVTKGANIYKDAVVGDEGKVIYINNAAGELLVEFDTKRAAYHTGYGRCEVGHGYWCRPYMLQHIEHQEEKIVITTDGKTTLARHFKGKTLICGSMAECSPSDTFDFLTGAGIVLDRLTKTEKKQYKTEPKFKAGDLVRVIGSGHDIMHSICINSLAVVVEVSNDARNGYDYLCEGGSRSRLLEQWIHEKDLEKFEIKKESK